MPFTALHFLPVAAAKALAPRDVHLRAAVAAQVAFDIEVGVRMLADAVGHPLPSTLHELTHTGPALLLIAALVVGIWHLFEPMSRRMAFGTVVVAWLAHALPDAYSHADALPDLQALALALDGATLSQQYGIEVATALCLWAGGLAAVLFALRPAFASERAAVLAWLKRELRIG